VGLKLEELQYKYIEYLNFVDIDAINKLKFNDKDVFGVISILEKYMNHNLQLELNIIRYFGEDI